MSYTSKAETEVPVYDLALGAAYHFTTQVSCGVKEALYMGRVDKRWIWGTCWRLAATLVVWFVE